MSAGAQVDPWAAAAKAYKPQQSESAPKKQEDDAWKIWQQNDAQSDTRNAVQKSFDENTKTDPSEPLLQTGLKSIVGAIGTPFMHPVETGKTLAKGTYNPPVNVDDGHLAWQKDNPMVAAVQGAYRDYKDGGAAYAATKAGGSLLGSAALGEAGGAALEGAKGGLRNIGERVSGYTSPVIDPALQQASKVATAIRPQGGVNVGLESDLASQLPHIKSYAEETGNPMRSQWEASQAAKGLAERGLQHFNENILGPNSDAKIPVGRSSPFQGFAGPKPEGDSQVMSLGEINDRIGKINNLLRPAFNAKSEGASMTALERQGLEEEAGMLRSKLYTELSQRTGIAPEAIKNLREGYGKQFSIADTIDTARRARLAPIGAAGEGTSVPLSKTGILQDLATKARGGQQFLADQKFGKALKPIQPRALEYPQPQYPQRLQGDAYNNPFLNRR